MNIINDLCSISYQNDASSSYMVFKLKEPERLIDYQIKIIKDNPMQNLLIPYRKQFDDEVFIYYDITSKITLEQFLLRRKLSRHEILTIINSITKGLHAAKRYLLQGGQFILDVKYVYINPLSMEVALAYMPIDVHADIKEDFRTFLIDLVVYKTLFLNSNEGSFVYKLLNLLKSEAFSMEQLDKLVFDIAVEEKGTEDNNTKNPHPKELAPFEVCDSQNEIELKRGNKKQTPKTATLKRKTYIIILVQLLFAAVALLVTRLLINQGQGLDIYSVIGGALLLLSIDFLTVKKLGLLDKTEAMAATNEEAAAALIEKNILEKRNRKNVLKQTKNSLPLNSIKPEVFVNMETNVLVEQEMPYACLIGCRDNQHERIVLSKASFIVGRLKNQVDYVSQNSAVGKVHAEIINRDGMSYIKDLNSRNGTYINGERIVSNVEYTIQNNDRVAFANSEYIFLWTGGTIHRQDGGVKIQDNHYNRQGMQQAGK